MSKRDDIQTAALHLFAEQGIEATTTREIAQRAGAAEGTLYRHYDGKADLAQSLYSQCTAELQGMIADADEASSAPSERLEVLVRTIFRFYATKPASCTYLLSARQSGVGGGDGEALPPPVRMVADILEDGREQGVFPESTPALVAGWILAMIQRTVLFLKAGALPIDEGDAIDRTVEAARRLAESSAG